MDLAIPRESFVDANRVASFQFAVLLPTLLSSFALGVGMLVLQELRKPGQGKPPVLLL